MPQGSAGYQGDRPRSRDGHAAGLSPGDTFAYGLAVDAEQPLLFMGTDFARTDVRVA